MLSLDAASVVQAYIHDNLMTPDILELTLDEWDFKVCSYERWAATEICEYIMNHPTKDPKDAIEEFIIKMFAYCKCGRESQNLIFKVAADIGNRLIDYL